MKYLYNSHYRADNGKAIYRLTVKLNPQQWDTVKEYFFYYNIGDLHGWGTIHPVKVIKALHFKELQEYDTLIQEAEEEARWSNSGLDKIIANHTLDRLKSSKENFIRGLI